MNMFKKKITSFGVMLTPVVVFALVVQGFAAVNVAVVGRVSFNVLFGDFPLGVSPVSVMQFLPVLTVRLDEAVVVGIFLSSLESAVLDLPSSDRLAPRQS